MKILQINNVYGVGSTGKLTKAIHHGLMSDGYSSVVIYGRGASEEDKNLYRVCGNLYGKFNSFISRLCGIPYGGCFISTIKIISIIKKEKPDVVHIQCINGNFVNIYRLIKETITYTDLNGVQRTEDFYFDLSKPEIVKMQASAKGGYDVQLKSIAASPNGALIMEFFENFIKTAYGEKSDDGRRFMKSEEISRGFMETPAYEVLFEKLVTDAGAASEFVNRVMRANGNKQAAPIASN